MTGRVGAGLLVVLLLASCAGPASRNPSAEHLARMKEVVAMIEAGEIGCASRCFDKVIALPADYRDLSAGGGEIIVTQTPPEPVGRVVFFTRRGIVDSWDGFVYVRDDQMHVPVLSSHLVEQVKPEPDWYWVSEN